MLHFSLKSMSRRGAFLLPALLLPLCAWSANYVNDIEDRATFQTITITEAFQPELLRTGKFLAPVSDDPALLPTAFQNVNVYGMHMDFMAAEFPDHFPFLTPERYMNLVERRAGRQYWAGLIYEIIPDNDGPRFGFTVFTDPTNQDELPTQNEAAALSAELNRHFSLGELCYIPDSEEARAAALAWQDPSFCITFLESEETTYEGYSVGTAYGHVRLLTAAQVEQMSAAGQLSWQDILVIDGVPRFLESVVSAIITSGRQGELSHVNVRASRRGTPNAYIKDPFDVFAPFDGQLVRIKMETVTYEGPEAATLVDAQAWWDAHRPKLEPPPPPDLAWSEFTSLADMGTDLPVLKNRFGAKASNLSLLFRSIPEAYRLPGFAIPYRYYEEFMESNYILDYSQVPAQSMTCRAYLDKLLNDPVFNSDSERRARLLDDFQDYLEDDTIINSTLVGQLGIRIEQIFGSPDVPVRFRSSSNMEDDLAFNGAGLYDSTGACVSDTFDGDDRGPSRCDPTKSNERTIQRALRKVWSSLWNGRAYEEREYYQLPHEIAAMGVLVSPAFIDETANGVAFTGNPLDVNDKRFLINVQIGEESVVNPDPDVIPERDYLTVTDGQVTQIHRASPSSIMPEGSLVLTDDQLRELGQVMAIAQENFPVDPGEYDPEHILLDMEFKFLPDGSLIIKQVRPYLISEREQGTEKDYSLVIPAGTEAVGVYLLKRPLDVEQELLSHVVFKSGEHALDADSPTFAGDLIEQMWIGGPDQEAVAQGPGEFKLLVTEDPLDGSRSYQYTYTQQFDSIFGTYEIKIDHLDFDGDQDSQDITFDEKYMSYTAASFEGIGLAMSGHLTADPDDYYQELSFGSVDYSAIPPHLITVHGEGGEKVELDYRRLRIVAAYGPGNLLGARIWLNEGQQEVTDYWRLVYRADIHNTAQRFRILLDPPLGDVHAVEIHEPFFDVIPSRFMLLDADMAEIRRIPVAGYTDNILSDPREKPFRRGDANADGRISLADAVTILLYISGSQVETECRPAFDVNDDSEEGLDDAIALLGYLFQGKSAPPPPFMACGKDATLVEDYLCRDYPPCKQ